MDELIKQVSDRTGISQDQARTAVTTVLGFLKDKLPAPIASQLDGLVGDSASAAGGVADGAAGAVGDIAGKIGDIFK
ncbi:MAG: hypothetical protein QOD75_1700 [Blastocatellia bacterium]|jgi:hypothetical protein|nr:hypothetical protein [Blastocatellia bacterium]